MSRSPKAGLTAALLLDLDGTLVDSEAIHRATYRAFFVDRGWHVADLALFTGRRAEDVFSTTPGPWSGADPLELASEVRSFVPTDASPAPVAGARQLIEAAATVGVPVAIVTSADPTWVATSLGVLGVRHHVDVIVTSHDVTGGKPDPVGFALACSQLGVNALDCVAVEDSPAGVKAAIAAGVEEVYGVSTTHAAEVLTEAGAVDVSVDLSDLAERIGLTERRVPR